jgi:hypothetical protein
VSRACTRSSSGASPEMLAHVIADYGPGDLAFAEVAQRLKLHLPDAEPIYTPVPAFATLAAGFSVGKRDWMILKASEACIASSL